MSLEVVCHTVVVHAPYNTFTPEDYHHSGPMILSKITALYISLTGKNLKGYFISLNQ